MLGVFRFLAGNYGRLAQGIIGSLFILLAMFWVDTTQGAIVGILGLVLLANSVFDVSAFAPLCGLPFGGKNLRKELLRRQLRPQTRSSGNHLYH
jgi:hypothetical protein